jgi:hypothetical protein
MPLGQIAFGYLKVSPSRMEYWYWPVFGMRGNWDDVDVLVRDRPLSILAFDHLRFTRGDFFGWPPALRLARTLRLRYTIPLSQFEGWPEGPLANDVRRFAPQLFVPTNRLR